MKKRIILSLFVFAVLILAACKNKAETVTPTVYTEQTPPSQVEAQTPCPPSEPEYPGVYRHAWHEEIAGNSIEMNSYIVLNADYTGFWIAQDIGTLSWDESRLVLSVGAVFDIALAQESGTDILSVCESQNEQGELVPAVFEKIEKLPTEIAELLSDF